MPRTIEIGAYEARTHLPRLRPSTKIEAKAAKAADVSVL
jgi:hypothetical protein